MDYSEAKGDDGLTDDERRHAKYGTKPAAEKSEPKKAAPTKAAEPKK